MFTTEKRWKVPEFSTKTKLMFNAVEKIENKFLQSIVDKGAIVFLDRGDGFTILGYESVAYVQIKATDDSTIHIECISTPVENRGRGSATHMMKLFTEIADNTNTKLELTATNVTTSRLMMMPPMAIAHGANKKGKIPVSKLPEWYSKFGFKRVGPKTKDGVAMTYTPKNSNNE
jgi:predicted GNAT family acetyltransferase